MHRTILSTLLVVALGPLPSWADGPVLTGAASARNGDYAAPGMGVGYYSGYSGSTRGTGSAPNADTRSAIAPPKPRTLSPAATSALRVTQVSSQRRADQPERVTAPEMLPNPSTARPPAPELVPSTPALEAGNEELAFRGIVNLQPAEPEETDLAFPINLATALRLADARPLIVSAAQAGAWVAEAQLQHAKVLWVPQFNAGTDYIRHDGFGPDFNRGINTAARPLNQNINFMYSGIGLTQNVAMTDAIFQPLAARQTLNARRWNIQTAKNDALFATASAYFSVHEFRGQYAGIVDTVQRGRKLVERVTFLSQDLVPRVEVDRAKRMLADLEQKAVSAREMWRVSSADLTQVLRLDPRVVIVPQEHDHLQITLMEPDRGLDELIPIGLINRPELASQQALVRSVAQMIRREKGRLLMPSLMLNGFQTPNEYIQFGAQGIGFDRQMNLWSLRDDLSPQALWQYEGLGFGNMARIKEQRGEQSLSIIEQFRIQDSVAGEITRAQARLQSAAVRVVQAERAMREALITFEGNYEGLAETTRFGNVLVQVYRPQEAVIALERLWDGYKQYFSTVAEYNRAQFELFHAMGYPAQEVAALRPPGNVQPVDTNRPAYLPPVGVGPPPATR